MNKQRRHFAGTEKVAILKWHLVDKVAISDLCDELGLYPNQVYGWLKEFFENGHDAFDNGRKSKAAEDAKDRKIEHLEAKLQRTTQAGKTRCRCTAAKGQALDCGDENVGLCRHS